MDVGVQLIFQNERKDMSDEEMFLHEAETAELADELGFDSVWPVEHHFRSYAMCPDNTQFLAYVAGRTKRIKLGTGAVILPWNDPLRVAEKITALDHLSRGRVLFGMGRGLSRKEYSGFGTGMDMNEARGRFDESARMILAALEKGYIEGSGPFYKQNRTDIRPAPTRSFNGRTYAVAVSTESVDSVASIGARMMFFTQYDAEKHKPGVDKYRELFRMHHGVASPPIVTVGFLFCDEDGGRAEEMARRYMTNYFYSLMEHYELAGDHFSGVKGYKSYAEAADMIRSAGLEATCTAFVNAQDFGTPKQVLDKIERRNRILGGIDVSMCTSYGGMDYADVEKNMRLFARTVMPELKSWKRKAATTEPEQVAASA